jgi:hypothetical protein
MRPKFRLLSNQNRSWPNTSPKRKRGSATSSPALALRASLALAVIAGCLASPALGQDNPILRERLTQMVVAELSRHSSLETAWYNEKSANRESWTSGKLLRRKIRLASWTEQSKSWVWLEDPAHTLVIDLKHLAIQNGRLEFGMTAVAKARFKVWGRIPKLAKATVGGTLRAQIEIEGAASIGDGRLENGQITRLHAVLHELRFNNEGARPMDNLVKDALNDYLDHNNARLRENLQKAVDRVHF